MASFDELKAKYSSVLDKGHDVGMTVQNLNAEGDKLLLRGVVPSEHGKDAIWDAVKAVDASLGDITVDVSVQAGFEIHRQIGRYAGQNCQAFLWRRQPLQGDCRRQRH